MLYDIAEFKKGKSPCLAIFDGEHWNISRVLTKMYNMAFTIECLENHKTVGLNMIKNNKKKKCRTKKQNIY